MDNILYLDDYINLYNRKEKKLIIYKPYKKTLINGFIKDKDKFIKAFNKLLYNSKLKKNIFNEKITIIINNLYSKEDKRLIKEIFEELNYTKINFINETTIIPITKNNLYINFNESFYYIYYVDNKGNIKTNIYNNDYLNKKLIQCIIEIINKNNIIIYGKEYEELELILSKKYNYFVYEESKNLMIKKLLYTYKF